MRPLEGRIALVTGSSRGIGAGIARLLAGRGARVAVHGRDEVALADVLGSIRRGGGEAIAVTGDVTRRDDLEAMRRRIEDGLGPVELLVVNAGGSPVRPSALEDIPDDGWRASLEGNLTSAFFTLKTFLPGMKQRRRGAVVTISSAAARRPHPGSPIAYAAAKAGLELLTQDAALQAGPFGVRVNCVAPETILTERTGQQIPHEIQEALVDQHPLRRLGTPDDVAHAVLYLLSDEASWVTGVIHDVAGGSVTR